MPRAVLEAILNLDVRNFQRGLARARAEANQLASTGLKALAAATVSAGVALVAGTRHILGLGGELNDLSARTGIAISELSLLQRAFEDNGAAAADVAPNIGRMQKAIVEATSAGKKFINGVQIDDLVGQSALTQFQTLGKRIAAIEDPALRAAAAMAVFGKSGGELLPLFLNGKAIDEARESLGRLPEIMERFGAAFDRADDVISALPQKANQFFAGFASEIVGSILGPLEQINKLDFTELGQRLGKAIRPWIEAIKSGDIWELFSLYAAQAVARFSGMVVDAAFEAANVFGSAFNALIDAFAASVTQVVPAFLDAADAFASALTAAIAVAVNSVQRSLMPALKGAAAGFLLAMPVLVPGARDAARALMDSAAKDAAAPAVDFDDVYRSARKPVAVPEAESFNAAFARWMATTEPGGMMDAFTDAWQPQIDALEKKLGVLGDASTGAAEGMGNAGNAGRNVSTTFDALSSAARTLAQRLGFTVEEAASGKRGSTAQRRAVEVQRLESEAKRTHDIASSYEDPESKAAQSFRERSAEFQRRADTLRDQLPGLKPSDRSPDRQEMDKVSPFLPPAVAAPAPQAPRVSPGGVITPAPVSPLAPAPLPPVVVAPALPNGLGGRTLPDGLGGKTLPDGLGGKTLPDGLGGKKLPDGLGGKRLPDGLGGVTASPAVAPPTPGAVNRDLELAKRADAAGRPQEAANARARAGAGGGTSADKVVAKIEELITKLTALGTQLGVAT
jgi:hypothetical protein